MKGIDFNELAKRAYENAKRKGFHDVVRKDAHWMMLVMCELAEAVEADRCGRRADRKEYERLVGVCEDIVRPHLFEMYIKDSVEDELADAVIRLLDFVGMKGIDIATRVDKITTGMEEGTEDDEANDESTERGKGFFTEDVYRIISMYFFDNLIEFLMVDLFDLAKDRDIDLMWFIEEKMKYNETRDLLHGKSY